MYLVQNRFIKGNGGEIVKFQSKYTPVPKCMQLAISQAKLSKKQD